MLETDKKYSDILSQVELSGEYSLSTTPGTYAAIVTIWYCKGHRCTVVHLTNGVGTKSIWAGASLYRYMSKDFLGFILTIHSVSKGNIVGNLWFGYNCQFYTQKTQN